MPYCHSPRCRVSAASLDCAEQDAASGLAARADYRAWENKDLGALTQSAAPPGPEDSPVRALTGAEGFPCPSACLRRRGILTRMWPWMRKHPGAPLLASVVLWVVVNLLIDMLHRHRTFHQEVGFVIVPGLFIALIPAVTELGARLGARRRNTTHSD